MRFALPLVIFFGIGVFLYMGLDGDPRRVPSPLIDKPAPEFSLPTLADPSASFGPADMKGKVWLFNIWGTWCASCRVEHPVLVDLARRNIVDIVGLNYKDDSTAAKK